MTASVLNETATGCFGELQQQEEKVKKRAVARTSSIRLTALSAVDVKQKKNRIKIRDIYKQWYRTRVLKIASGLTGPQFGQQVPKVLSRSH